jgi:hypothetical protein
MAVVVRLASLVNKNMSQAKLLIWSLISGVVITGLLATVAVSVENKNIAAILLWQFAAIAYLVGPGPLLGLNEQGEQMYEGTPIHMLILPVGLFLTVATYSTVIYLILRAVFKNRVGGS